MVMSRKKFTSFDLNKYDSYIVLKASKSVTETLFKTTENASSFRYEPAPLNNYKPEKDREFTLKEIELTYRRCYKRMNE